VEVPEVEGLLTDVLDVGVSDNLVLTVVVLLRPLVDERSVQSWVV
jgi:hypothetical protein